MNDNANRLLSIFGRGRSERESWIDKVCSRSRLVSSASSPSARTLSSLSAAPECEPRPRGLAGCNRNRYFRKFRYRPIEMVIGADRGWFGSCAPRIPSSSGSPMTFHFSWGRWRGTIDGIPTLTRVNPRHLRPDTMNNISATLSLPSVLGPFPISRDSFGGIGRSR
jgi:hypothetical protein